MYRRFFHFIAVVVFLFSQGSFVQQSFAQGSLLDEKDNLITAKVLKDIRSFVDTDIVRYSIQNQNTKLGSLAQDQIDALDKQWRAERQSDDQPLISATLSNPLSSYLTRVQAHSKGLYTEIFAMDQNGLNVGQSSVSSDFWQGDEAKFSESFGKGKGAVFIDEPEFNDELGVWAVQVSMAISDDGNNQLIGAITIEINLTELQRRQVALN